MILNTKPFFNLLCIHHKLPVRAQWNRSSVEVTRKPLSVSSPFRLSKNP